MNGNVWRKRFAAVFCLVIVFCGLDIQAHATGTTIEGAIRVMPIFPPSSKPDQILPGSLMQLFVDLKNVGDVASGEGKVFLRFVLPKELQKESRDGGDPLRFATEEMGVKAIAPGEMVEVAFSTHHQWPTLYDFIRYDWGMRQYEAVVRIGKEEKVVGTMRIAFSAQYYPGYVEERPQVFGE